jgi:hypothetical protein
MDHDDDSSDDGVHEEHAAGLCESSGTRPEGHNNPEIWSWVYRISVTSLVTSLVSATIVSPTVAEIIFSIS